MIGVSSGVSWSLLSDGDATRSYAISSCSVGMDDCEFVGECENIPSRTDHRRRRRLDWSPVLRRVTTVPDSDVRGLCDPDVCEPIKIGACSTRVPAGGNSGRRLSMRASASEMRSRVGVVGEEGSGSPSSSSSASPSPSPSPSGADESSVAAEPMLRTARGVCGCGDNDNACWSVSSVAEGEGGAAVTVALEFPLEVDKSRLAGRFRRWRDDEVCPRPRSTEPVG